MKPSTAAAALVLFMMLFGFGVIVFWILQSAIGLTAEQVAKGGAFWLSFGVLLFLLALMMPKEHNDGKDDGDDGKEEDPKPVQPPTAAKKRTTNREPWFTRN